MEKLFYVIYNSYYKHGEYKNDVPLVTAWGILVIAFLSLTIAVIYAVHAFLEPMVRAPSQVKDIWMPIYVLYSLLYYFFFVFRKRYMKIYNRYKDAPFLNSRTGKAVVWSFVIFSILSPIVFGLLRNKIVFGAWT